MEVTILMAVMGLVTAAFYMQAKTARRAKNNTMRLLAEVNAEKQAMLEDIRILVKPSNRTSEEFAAQWQVLDKWQLQFGMLVKDEIRYKPPVTEVEFYKAQELIKFDEEVFP